MVGARALLVALLAGACDPGFEAKSIVIDLRMLGVQAEPPEIVEEFDVENPAIPAVPPVTITALVDDPRTDAPLAWRMVACPPDNSRRCEGETQFVGEGAGEPIQGVLEADAELLADAFAGDQQLGFGGLQVMVELTIWPEGAAPADGIVGAKMVLYAPRIPAERTANSNPTVAAILVDETEEWTEGGACRAVTAGSETRMEPVEPEGVRETYVLPTLDGGSRTITENLRYSWFATAGSFSAENTGGPVDFFGNPPPLHTRWTAPEGPPEGRPVTLWLVQRDERGGTSWTTRCFEISLP